MLLKETATGHLVEVTHLPELFNPFESEITGRYNIGEDRTEETKFAKSNLTFLSKETLPQCWIDPHYRDKEVQAHMEKVSSHS